MAKTQALTTKDLQAGFGVGHMTIFNWRKGSVTKAALPAITDEAGRVTFSLAAVKSWAKQHKLAFTAPTETAAEGKPGPKAKVVVAKKAAKTKATKPRKTDPATIDAIQDVAIKATGGRLKRSTANAEATAQ